MPSLGGVGDGESHLCDMNPFCLGKAGTATSAMSEKVRTRLEELDDFEEGSQKELLNLTQQDYVNRIEELNQSLKDAWASDQKVKALKIVIQVRSSDFFFFPFPRISYVKLLYR